MPEHVRRTNSALDLLTRAEVARATGASERTVRRWVAGAAPQARYRERLDDLQTLMDELAQNYTEKGCQQWMRGRHRLLNAKRPLDLLAAGEFERVYGAARGLSEGVFV